MDREKYLLAKKNGLVERFRGDEISKRICQKYPFSAQIALLADKDYKYSEWADFQAFRSQVKAEVDSEIAELEYQISHGA